MDTTVESLKWGDYNLKRFAVHFMSTEADKYKSIITFYARHVNSSDIEYKICIPPNTPTHRYPDKENNAQN